MLSRLSVLKHPHNKGWCPICEQKTVFVEMQPWLRDYYICYRCGSIPRQRALVGALERFVPDWRDLELHESSPSAPLSTFLSQSCRSYSASHYFEDVPRGQERDGFRSEDLSRLTFPDATFDVIVTSDVFEHVLEPELAFSEIARVLRPGGAHVFTMPWYPELDRSRLRARLRDGAVEHLLEPMYHGNPIDDDGSLVTTDWGKDFPEVIRDASGLTTVVYLQHDRTRGIDGKFLEVFVSIKPGD